VIIDFEEVLIEVEPGFGVALADGRPVDRVQHAGEGAEGSLDLTSTSKIYTRN
jgi:hypothetical protein